jgi:hypothetical protein
VTDGAHDFFVTAAIVTLLAAYLSGTTANGAGNCFETATCFAGHTIFPFAPIIVSA